MLDLVDYERKTHEAVQVFWKNNKNMDGFMAMVTDIIRANGLVHADIYPKSPALTLPGYFRPTRPWDMVIINKGQLVAAIKLKSQIGSSFGNSFDSKAKKAIANAYDFRRAYASGAFGESCPFVGWLIVVEDAPKSRATVKDNSPHFPVFEEFRGASYLKRYDLLCQKLVKEQLYTKAALITSPRSAAKSGEFSEMSSMTSLKTFVIALAGHVTAEAARLG